MSRDPFVSALTSVVDGTRRLEDFARVVIAGAVEDALLRVSRDHDLDYSAMVDAHLDDVVDRHSRAGGDGACGQCNGTTAAGKRCPRRGAVRGYCRAHAEQLALADKLTAGTEAYQASQRAKKAGPDPVALALTKVGAEVVDPRGFVLQKRDAVRDVFDML
jgi:hypothetical protein